MVPSKKHTFEVSGCNAYVVFLTGVVKLGQAPVDEPQLPVLVVDHDVVGLHVPVHDAHTVAVIERLEQLVQVETDVIVGQRLIEQLEVRVVHVLEDESWCPRHGIFHHCLQRNNVGPAPQVFQDLDLTFDLLLLHRLF